MSPTKCLLCGAEFPELNSSCTSCGSRGPCHDLDAREIAFKRVRASSAYRERDSQERIAELPDYETPRADGVALLFVLFGVWLLSAMGAEMVRVGAVTASLVGTAVVGGSAAFSFAYYVWRRPRSLDQRFRQSPVLARAAIVVRNEKWRHFRGPFRYGYCITFECEDGATDEYNTNKGGNIHPFTEALHEKIDIADTGILYTRAFVPLDFDHVPTQ